MGGPDATLTPLDMAFAVSGGRLERDHSLALWQALAAAAPWLADEETVAVQPIRAASLGAEGLVLGRHSRLLLRLPEGRVAAALALCGTRLDVGGTAVEIGLAKTRPLAPHRTLYAHRVAAAGADEAAFVAQVRRELGALGVRGDFVVGRQSVTRGPSGALAGYSLMLAELSPQESLALQAAGLGAHRRLGFGVFVGHK